VKSPWSNPRVVERLVELRQAGHPVWEVAKKLSEEFDVRVTRGAVLGKMQQLKLPRRDPTPSFTISLHGPLDHGSLANLHAALGDWLKSNGRPRKVAQLEGAE
jgi:hypothetical protein